MLRHHTYPKHVHHAKDRTTFGDKVADHVAGFVGSWIFIGIQTSVMACWVAGNAYLFFHFDPFPFIFLNLFMSAEAAYSTPIIMMAQNRASDRDRMKAEHDYKVNEDAKREVEQLLKRLDAIERDKLDKILAALEPKRQPSNLRATATSQPSKAEKARMFPLLKRIARS